MSTETKTIRPSLSDDALEAPVFICGHRKGGTTVLLCLMDNHPELLTYPADSAFFYKVFPPCEHLTKEETIDRLASSTIKENLSSEMKVVKRNDLFDVDAIAETYREFALQGDDSPASHLRSLIQAYGAHCGQDGSLWKRWVEKTTSTEIYAQEVADWFPHAKFVHVIRDPRDNFGSLKSGWDARYKNQESDQRSLAQSLIDRGGLGLRMAALNEEALGKDRYLVVKFEEMTEQPEEWLRRIADFIGVTYDKSLETPTVNGIPWPGNNFDGLTFQGLSAANAGRWRERIDWWEAALIEGHLGDVMELWGYNLETSPTERARACSDHYKWFNFLPTGNRGDV